MGDSVGIRLVIEGVPQLSRGGQPRGRPPVAGRPPIARASRPAFGVEADELRVVDAELPLSSRYSRASPVSATTRSIASLAQPTSNGGPLALRFMRPLSHETYRSLENDGYRVVRHGCPSSPGGFAGLGLAARTAERLNVPVLVRRVRPVSKVFTGAYQRRYSVRQFVCVVPVFAVAVLLGALLVEVEHTRLRTVHERHDLVPLVPQLLRPEQGGVDPAQSAEVVTDRPPASTSGPWSRKTWACFHTSAPRLTLPSP